MPNQTPDAALAPVPAQPLGIEAKVVYPILIVVALFFLCVHTVLDPDCWFHMAFGRTLLETRSFPRADIFSHTSPGGEWISSGWLPSVLLHLAYSAFAERGLVAIVFAVHCAVWLGLYAAAIRLCGNRGSAVAVLFVGMTASYLRMTPRPELASHLFLAALLVALAFASRVERPSAMRAAIAVPCIMLLWANCHAGFMAGFVQLAAFVGYQLFLWRWNENSAHARIAGVCSIGFATWMANPWGWRAVDLAGKIENIPDVDRYILEWMPLLAAPRPDAAFPRVALAVAIGMVVVAAAAIVSARRRPAIWIVAAALAFAVLEFRERRHIALAAIVLSFAAVQALDRVDGLFAGRRRHLLTGLAIALCAAVVGAKTSGALAIGKGWPSAKVDDTLLPASATRFLIDAKPPEKMFNDYGPGGYLLYHLGPETKVFIDGRLDIYDTAVWLDYLAIVNDRMPIAEAVEKYGLSTFVVYIRGAALAPGPDGRLPIARRIAAEPGFRIAYFDDAYMVCVRETDETRAWTEQHAMRYLHPFDLAALYRALGNPDTRGRAEAEIARMRELSGDSARTLLIASMAARQLAKHSVADELMKEAVRKNPALEVKSAP